MQNDSSDLSFCPSFNSYSSGNNLVDIAATVSRESAGALDGEEFEFSISLEESPEASSFPIFNRDLLSNGEEEGKDDEVKEAVRIPLRNLFISDGDLPSSSSSEADELEGVPAETFCVWKPKQSPMPSPNRCTKSKSTGSSSSRRWRLIKDLLKRSNSDSKFSGLSSLFLNFDHNKSTTEKKQEEKTNEKTAATAAKKQCNGEVTATKMKRVEKASAHEVFYLRNKALREGDKRRSYLPYRRDLVGFFP
ncbi:Detected protein of unknown function [Hibiscus syriacus]|uniref:Uncharacterized protein n=1 Tax=Hibiscus syriacus TaxID=106335 RepID=A0A6A2WPZ3_HIBSY|nr:uncharacterized protein LOC120185554 [Hibiscus syriacus]KAE8662892.1 Detected protein of unknown function [Hibiscus syriacus]